jgi:serine/threonine-protein kinase
MNATPHPLAQPRRVCTTCHAIFRQNFARCPLDGSALESSETDPLVGVTLADRYVIEKSIGEGGMGRVYRARHTRMSRHFAIKVLYGDLAADEIHRQRFEREAEAASRLSHINLIAVVDFGKTSGGLLYLAMEVIDGSSMRQLIEREAPFDTDRATNLLRQMASGLEHAHSRGLVHRDFKPDNVLVADTEDGEIAKILDFGIARIVEEGTAQRLTNDGVLMGTPAFMSPEQAAGKRVDHRSDLFSLGMVLYEMVAGKLPFDGDAMAVLRQNMVLDPPAMSARAGIPVEPRLEVIATRLLAKQAEQRFQSAGELVDAIDAWWVPPRGRRAAMQRPSTPRVQRDASASSFAPTEMSSTELPAVSSLAQTVISSTQLPTAALPAPRRRLVPWIAGGVLMVGIAISAGAALMRGGDSEAVAGREGAAVAGGDAGGIASRADRADAAVVVAATAPDAAPIEEPGEEPGEESADAAALQVEAPVEPKKPHDRKSSGKTDRARQPVTAESYRQRYGELATKYQRLFKKVGDHSPLQSEVKTLGREVENLPYNPDESALARAYQSLRRLERRVERLLKRAGK